MSKLSDLFRWKTELKLTDNKNEPILKESGEPWIVYLRVVGDNDLTSARNEALKRSRLLRKKLRDKESDEYVSNFSGMESLTKDEMVNAIIVSELQDYRDEGLTKVKEEPIPELPDEATLEQQEEYQAKLDEKENNPNSKLVKFIEDKSEERRKKLVEEDIELIKTKYVEAVINIRCSEEFIDVFRNYCVYRGIYEDAKYTKLAFDSFSDYLSSASQLKNMLSLAYNKLELGVDVLKN